MDEKESKHTTNLQFVFCLLLFHLQQHHVYWPGNMSCCVKSSVLRRLAEQKGQKSMLIKECGQLLACGFALIKPKCSCSQKTLLIYSSNSEHWLWVRPVGFVALRGLTKKSQHFLQRYEVCVCICICVCVCLCVHTGCPCGKSMPWAVFSRLCQKHVAWSNTPASHGVKSLVLCTSQSLGQSMVNQIYSLSCREQLHDEFQTSYLIQNYCRDKPTRLVHYYYYFLANYADEGILLQHNITASLLLWQQIHLVRLYFLKKEHCGVWAANAHLWKLFHQDERQPTQLQIADELIFSWGAAPVSGLHVGLTQNVEQISQLILV